jgi:hypothetical protein
MKTYAFLRRFGMITQRRNGRRPAVEPLEGRLALSPTLPLPPPGPLTTVVQYHPPNPCISTVPSMFRPTPVFPPVPVYPPQPIHPPQPI